MSENSPTPTSPSEAVPLVRIERHGDGGHVAEIILDRPEAMNAVSVAMAEAIAAACAEVSADDRTRVVVLSSSRTKAFCVGADLLERNSFSNEQMLESRPRSATAYRSVLDLAVPAIAAVEGYALGGGFELALSCDVIVAGRSAVVGLPEVSVGVIPGGGGTQLLPRRTGSSVAAKLIFTAARLSAEEAAGLRAVDEVVESGGARDRALELASQMARNSPVGLRGAKRALRAAMASSLEDGLAVEDASWEVSALSGDRAEGVAAFVAKRPPEWPGR